MNTDGSLERSIDDGSTTVLLPRIDNPTTAHHDADVTISDRLEYPRNFFHPISGKSPSSAMEASLLWSFRKNRPKKGCIEKELPNGELMLYEVQEIRKSLREYVQDAYLQEVRQKAKDEGLLINSLNIAPVIERDIKNAVSMLENTEENQHRIYKIFHQFHRTRTWQSNVVDLWMDRENMCLLDESSDSEDSPKKKKYHEERGGFGIVARQAKGQAVKRFMQPMLRNAGWCIATTNN
jgi:hypothetical protein